jgi:hypothetical protein
VKVLLTIVLACLLICAQSCTKVNRDSAGLQHIAGSPPTEATTEPPEAANETVIQSDASANGGMSLRAAAPYSGSGAPAQQNVNPGPFVIAGQSPAGTSGSMPADSLTRSADGTMSGPNDLPAATTGWGTAATNYGGSASTAPAKPAAKSAPK